MSEWDQGVIVPVQIREDHWVRIGYIPHDLTDAEAGKIARVIRAYASGTEAQRAATAKQGAVHDGPTAESGDAQ